MSDEATTSDNVAMGGDQASGSVAMGGKASSREATGDVAMGGDEATGGDQGVERSEVEGAGEMLRDGDAGADAGADSGLDVDDSDLDVDDTADDFDDDADDDGSEAASSLQILDDAALAPTEVPIERATPEVRDVALKALREITDEETFGALARVLEEHDGALSLQFASTMPGYPDWYWTVSVAQIEGADPTVLEAELLPSETSLLAPAWKPWSERLDEYKAQERRAQAEQAAAEADAALDGDPDDEPDEDGYVESDDDALQADDDFDGVDDPDADADAAAAASPSAPGSDADSSAADDEDAEGTPANSGRRRSSRSRRSGSRQGRGRSRRKH